jgi:D-amino-acid oxidase
MATQWTHLGDARRIRERDEVKVAIVGAGVSGLTCASQISESSEVTLFHDLSPEHTTSAIATAIWHVYLVDPSDTDVLEWADQTLRKLCQLIDEPDAGLSLVTGVELFRRSDPRRPVWANSAIDFAMIDEEELLRRFPGVRWGYRLASPTANMAKYLPWLKRQCSDRGVRFEQRTIGSWDELTGFDYIVNCCGLRTRDLTEDPELFGMRGQYLVLEPLTSSYTEYIGDDEHPDGMAYMIPRDGEIMVGGTEEFSEEMVFDVIEEDLLRRAGTYCSGFLKGASVTRRVVGIRPCRKSGTVVLGRDVLNPRLIHNYGHGGSGFSLSWGCARAVHHLVS